MSRGVTSDRLRDSEAECRLCGSPDATGRVNRPDWEKNDVCMNGRNLETKCFVFRPEIGTNLKLTKQTTRK